MDRRKFIGSLAALGIGGAAYATGLDKVAAENAEPWKRRGPLRIDENLVCIISDLHLRPGEYQQQYFERTVQDILSLNPRPLNVICLGDIAYLTGKVEEYELAKRLLAPLEEAGMHVTLGMGNHDRRENFALVFPDKAAASELPHRYVYTVETPRADFIVLDSLDQGEDTETWITPGVIDDEQRAWLAAKAAGCRKQLFVMAHHPMDEIKVTAQLYDCPHTAGFIYGHKHEWDPGRNMFRWSEGRLLRNLCVPSTGHWGDIGFTLLKLEKERAVASFVQRGFFFPVPLKEGQDRPAVWDEIERSHKNASCVFPYV